MRKRIVRPDNAPARADHPTSRGAGVDGPLRPRSGARRLAAPGAEATGDSGLTLAQLAAAVLDTP
ncbi:MAG: hypothetical protein KC486_15905, partial [Myxococcales bacterium]|nr:hypothetical protein [Myxococcales bacterium]